MYGPWARNHTRARSVLSKNSHSSPQGPGLGITPDPTGPRQGFTSEPSGHTQGLTPGAHGIRQGLTPEPAAS